MLDSEQINAQLGNVIFRLEWFNAQGKPLHGTGFFVTPGGLALTAFHNLPDAVLDDPQEPLIARYKGQDIRLKWVLPGEQDRKWQQEYELAVLQAEPVPPNLPVQRCQALDRPGRGAVWANRTVILSGFAEADKGGDPLLPGHVSLFQPIRDTRRDVNGVPAPWVPKALAIGPDYEGSMAELRGMSGGPVWDTESGATVGVIFGVQRKVYATELAHLVHNWPPARDFVETAVPPEPNFFASLPSHVRPVGGIVLALAAAMSWLFWPVRPAVPQKLAVQVIRLAKGGARDKLAESTTFAEGERVRFAITPPVSGQLYVVDREISSSGTKQPRYLIFPTRRAGYGRNFAKAGTEVIFPGAEDDPPYVEPRSGGDPNYAGEELTVYVLKSALPVDLANGPIELAANLLPAPGLTPRIFAQPEISEPLAVERIRVKVDRDHR